MRVVVFFQSARFGEHVHPFLIEEVKGFLRKGHTVTVVCEKEPIDYFELSSLSNVTVAFFRKKIFTSFVKSLFFMFNKYVREEVSVSLKLKKFGFRYLRDYFRISMIGFMMYSCCNKIIKKADDSFILDSYWFSNSAFAAALLKRKWKNKIVAFSRAHSFEIDPIKNSFFQFELKNFSYNYLDFIGFISEYGRHFFVSEILSKYKNMKTDKCLLFRLGTSKIENIFNPNITSNGFVTIVSCSRIAPEKRVDLIASALVSFSDANIKWFHFGPGKIEDILSIVNSHESKLTCEMMGDCTNSFIHDFYKKHHVDCLINLSISEGIPVSVMEAFSYGIPCIATAVGGIPEIVENEYNGFLVDEKINNTQIHDFVLRIMSDSSYRQNAYSTWLTKYNFDVNFDLICDEIDKHFINYDY